MIEKKWAALRCHGQSPAIVGLYWGCALLFCTRVVLSSWLEEDAFITFRVVDNFVHGHGLRWNIHERVQTYTNPLWMLLHIILHALTSNVILSTFLLSWGCLIGTLVVVRHTFSFELPRHIALFLVPLLVSPTSTLFFTSGLETPLLSLLFACLGFVLIRRPRHHWFWLSFVTAASLACRLDVAVFYAPLWTYLLYAHHKALEMTKIALGAVPAAAWLLFSFFYYGFFMPNTAPAKLRAGLPEWDYVSSGLAYTLDFVLAEPWSALLIGAGAAYFPYEAWRSRRTAGERADASIAAALSLGVSFYCLYIVSIGGYQLSLRMYSLPVMAACWLWLWRFPSVQVRHYSAYAVAALGAFCFALTPQERGEIGIIREKQISGFPWAQYLFTPAPPSWLDYRLIPATITRQPDHSLRDFRVQVNKGIGQLGYYGGPFTIIIDPFALGDPLLARLPSATPHLPRVGHIVRRIPDGYLEAVRTGSTEHMPAPLAEYYRKLRLITQGELWDLERLKTAILFNLGAYDELLSQYLAQRPVEPPRR